MDGLTFLRKLMRQHPMPVVLCTEQAERAVTALEMGALEVIAKPDWRDPAKMAGWAHESPGEHSQRRARRTLADARGSHRGSTRPPPHGRCRSCRRLPYVPRGQLTERDRSPSASAPGACRPSSNCWPDFPADAPGHRDRPAHAAGLHRRLRPAARTTTRTSRSRSPRPSITIRSGPAGHW